MSPIPGIDDHDDQHEDLVSDTPVLQTKRPLGHEQGSGREKRMRVAAEVDDEDRDLYGDESGETGALSQVSAMTLVTQKLPVSMAEFLGRLLSTNSFAKEEVQRLQQLYDVVRPLQRIDVTNVFQVTFATCLSLDAAYRQRLLPKSECVRFYPYFKIRKSTGIMELHCISFTDAEQPISPSFGQLVSVYIQPIHGSVAYCRTFAYVEESRRRLPEKAMRMEVDLMSHHRVRDGTLVHELLLHLPFSEELYHTGNFHVKVAPVCLVNDLLMQARAVYEIGTNPLFRYFQTKDFSLSPTGMSIVADQKSFSPLQLEAIQRAFDLVMHPFSEHGNPCKAVFTDGQPDHVLSVTMQILKELVRATDLQFIVSSSDHNLSLLRRSLSKLSEFESKKSIFFAGHEEDRLRSVAQHYITNEMEGMKKRASAEDEDAESKRKKEARIQLLSQCLDAMSQESGRRTTTAEVLDLIDDFCNRALQYLLRSARLIFGTLKEFSRSSELITYLRTPKVYPSLQQTTAGQKRKQALSACMIADAQSLTDTQLMTFANDFSVHRFILSSSWFTSEELTDLMSRNRQTFGVEHSFKDRVKLSASTSTNPFIVNVSPSE